MESHTETGRIKLNLVITYPVRWSRIHVMEDYIQNFYDITGAEKFSRDFLEAMKSFFYPENPLFGECIVNEKDYAVYSLKQSAIGEDHKIYGRVFASMQERAQLYNS